MLPRISPAEEEEESAVNNKVIDVMVASVCDPHISLYSFEKNNRMKSGILTLLLSVSG